jgi:hypothetical protein
MSITHLTVGNIISYADEIYPNNISSATKYLMVNDILKDIKPFTMTTEFSPLSTTLTGCITLTSGVSSYSLPNNVSIQDIRKFLVNQSTGAYTSTCNGTSYSYKGLNDDYEGNCYYDGLNGYFGVFPTPTSDETGHIVKLRYQIAPTVYTTSDSTTYLTLDPDYEELLKIKLISKIAKSGDYPDIDMANNWEYESIEKQKTVKLRNKQKQQKQRGDRISYKDWTW